MEVEKGWRWTVEMEMKKGVEVEVEKGVEEDGGGGEGDGGERTAVISEGGVPCNLFVECPVISLCTFSFMLNGIRRKKGRWTREGRLGDLVICSLFFYLHYN